MNMRLGRSGGALNGAVFSRGGSTPVLQKVCAGDGSNPHTLNATVGQIVPSGTLVQGLPEI